MGSQFSVDMRVDDHFIVKTVNAIIEHCGLFKTLRRDLDLTR